VKLHNVRRLYAFEPFAARPIAPEKELERLRVKGLQGFRPSLSDDKALSGRSTAPSPTTFQPT
jgi:hypothetical protein